MRAINIFEWITTEQINIPKFFYVKNMNYIKTNIYCINTCN